jgi:hypothetical protein
MSDVIEPNQRVDLRASLASEYHRLAQGCAKSGAVEPVPATISRR